MLCVRCKKRPAIVFVQKLEAGEAKSEGYCLSCARELGIKPVDDIMKQFGISDQDLEAMEERFAGMMENGDMDPAAMMQQLGMMAPQDDADGDEAPDDDTDEGGDGDFTPGGNATFPFGIFGGRRKTEEAPEKEVKSKNDRGKKRKFLDNYCENLTRKARDGKLDRIVGRDREIYRTVQILSRRQKNNPCLIGEAGVGKTAIAEGIARRIVDGDVPENLRSKQIFSLANTTPISLKSDYQIWMTLLKKAGWRKTCRQHLHSIRGAARLALSVAETTSQNCNKLMKSSTLNCLHWQVWMRSICNCWFIAARGGWGSLFYSGILPRFRIMVCLKAVTTRYGILRNMTMRWRLRVLIAS